MQVSNLVVKFLYKFFFILKAASEGWRVTYCGGNHFAFYQNISDISDISAKLCDTTDDFLAHYSARSLFVL